MTSLKTHHSPFGAGDFLGMRRDERGRIEIVYDDGVATRMVWRVRGTPDPKVTDAALKAALSRNKVVPALYAEMKKRAIGLEAITPR